MDLLQPGQIYQIQKSQKYLTMIQNITYFLTKFPNNNQHFSTICQRFFFYKIDCKWFAELFSSIALLAGYMCSVVLTNLSFSLSLLWFHLFSLVQFQPLKKTDVFRRFRCLTASLSQLLFIFASFWLLARLVGFSFTN